MNYKFRFLNLLKTLLTQKVGILYLNVCMYVTIQRSYSVATWRVYLHVAYRSRLTTIFVTFPSVDLHQL